jgi:hypothetical protein
MMAFQYEKCKSRAQGRAGKKPSEYPYRYDGEDEFEESESSSAEAGLRAAMDEHRNASLEGDTDKIASSLVDEHLQTDINGYVQDKTAWLNEIPGGCALVTNSEVTPLAW